MIDPKKLLNDLLGSQVPGTQGTVRDAADATVQKAKDNPLAAGAILAVLLGTGVGRELTGSALKLGGAAAVAGLAYKAYQNYQAGKAPVEQATTETLPPPEGSEFDIEATPNSGVFALSVVRVMIAAARADGHIDEQERSRILDRLKLSGVNEDVSAFMERELASPVDLDGIIAGATTEAQKIELYTAARLAIEPDSRAERGFLDQLAGRLDLADQLVDHIEATVSSAKV